VTHKGVYEELLASSSSFAPLLDDIHQHELGEQQSTVDLAILETDDTKDALLPPTSVEIKQEGIVKWHVYTTYLRAGVGLLNIDLCDLQFLFLT
jgi:hypothetical protein